MKYLKEMEPGEGFYEDDESLHLPDHEDEMEPGKGFYEDEDLSNHEEELKPEEDFYEDDNSKPLYYYPREDNPPAESYFTAAIISPGLAITPPVSNGPKTVLSNGVTVDDPWIGKGNSIGPVAAHLLRLYHYKYYSRARFKLLSGIGEI